MKRTVAPAYISFTFLFLTASAAIGSEQMTSSHKRQSRETQLSRKRRRRQRAFRHLFSELAESYSATTGVCGIFLHFLVDEEYVALITQPRHDGFIVFHENSELVYVPSGSFRQFLSRPTINAGTRFVLPTLVYERVPSEVWALPASFVLKEIRRYGGLQSNLMAAMLKILNDVASETFGQKIDMHKGQNAVFIGVSKSPDCNRNYSLVMLYPRAKLGLPEFPSARQDRMKFLARYQQKLRERLANLAKRCLNEAEELRAKSDKVLSCSMNMVGFPREVGFLIESDFTWLLAAEPSPPEFGEIEEA